MKPSIVGGSRAIGMCLAQEGKLGNRYSAIVSRATKVGRGTKDCAASRLVPESPIWQQVCLVKGSHTAKPGWEPAKTNGQWSQQSGVTVGRNSC